MKLFALYHPATYNRKDRICGVHLTLFHGNAIRADALANLAEWNRPYSSPRAHDIGDDLSHPLLLIRSGLCVPLIFMPYPLVIREEIYQHLRDFPGLVFVEAKPKKLVRLWKPVGDFSFLRNPKDPIFRHYRYHPSDNLLDRMPNDPSLFPTFPRCYEMVSYNVARYRGDEPRTVRVNFILDDGMETEVHWSCPSWIIDKYPLLWGTELFLREDLFELVEDAIDYDFFAVRPVEI